MSNFMEKLSKSETSKRYTPEQKLEAVLLNITGAKTIQEVAEEKNVSTKSVTLWKNEFFANASRVFKEKETESRNSNRGQQEEVERLNKEVSLLKKLLQHYKQTRNKPSSRSPDG